MIATIKCGFCGEIGGTLVDTSSGSCRVRCTSCKSIGPNCKSHEDAIAAWNSAFKNSDQEFKDALTLIIVKEHAKVMATYAVFGETTKLVDQIMDWRNK